MKRDPVKKEQRKEAFRRVEKKNGRRNDILRIALIAFGFLVQLAFLVLLFLWLDSYAVWIDVAMRVIAVILMLAVFGRKMNSAFKFPWIIFIGTFPIVGAVLYLFLGNRFNKYGAYKRYQKIDSYLAQFVKQDGETLKRLGEENPDLANQARAVFSHNGLYPLYGDTEVKYFAEAKDGLKDMERELMKAKKFIFMEYYAIENKEAFRPIKDILIKKVKEGVTVRLFYDNIGSFSFIDRSFLKEMKGYGIDTRVFNPITLLTKIFMNNRDHRKIMIIDGKVGYTGGYNLANEYFGITHPYGYWKDTAVRLKGNAVNSLTLIFLENWNAIKKPHENDVPSDYLVKNEAKENQGYCVPYASTPLNSFPLAEDVYLNILKSAKKYVYISTPYLILSDDMIRELAMAAHRGVDVRLLTPGIPDKKLIYNGWTRSYYHDLIQEGVRIYEYTPGFNHAKLFVSDDLEATVGTVNLDFRSLYLHFEDGVLFMKNSAVSDVKNDLLSMMKVSKEITKDDKLARRTSRLARLIAPLL